MKYQILLFWFLPLALSIGCGQLFGESEAELQETVAAAVAATQTAAPTNTPLPTATPVPTDTPTPAPTDTPVPTETPTPAPTETPTPESTETPAGGAASVSGSGVVETLLDGGETLYEVPEAGFSIALPEDWQSIDLDQTNLTEAIGAVGEQNESLKGMFTNEFFQNLIASGIKFYAINTSARSLLSNPPVNINVLTQDLPIALPLEQYAELNVAQLEQYFDLTSEIEQEELKLGETDAVKLSYTANLTDAFGKPVELANTQYLILDGSSAYVITLTMPRKLAEEYLQPSVDAVETFRLQ